MTVADDLATLREALAPHYRSEEVAALDRVEAEIARLQRENTNNATAFEMAMRQAEAAEAAATRLRDGLREIASYDGLGHQGRVAAALARALLADDGAARDERCDKCGLPRDAHPGRLFCPAPGGAA